jgi:exosome complex exonuclease DIS3/RRP44
VGGQVERLAFSCVWTLDVETAEIIDVKFHKSVIKSVAAMSYAKAQAIIDDASDASPLAQDLRLMLSITQKLRAKRVERGALSLASPEVRFELDSETHDPINVSMYEHKLTNGMVEEMMLLANMSVATKIHQHFPACAMLRRHPAPPPANFEPLRKVVEALGFELDSSSNKSLAASLDKVVPPRSPCIRHRVFDRSGRSSSKHCRGRIQS